MKTIKKIWAELNEIRKLIKDKNFRIYLSNNGINIFNSEIHLLGKDPFDFYKSLDVDNDNSAF